MPYPRVISIGNMLVEVMRVNLDEPLNEPGTFVGPFPSGDTSIYIDTVPPLKGMDLRTAGRFANAVGALAVTKKGPMQGAPTRDQVAELMGQQPQGA